MVGTFANPSSNEDMARLSSCNPPEVGVTHSNNTDRTGPLTFTWTAPAAGTGPIWFRYTIVQNVLTWWADDSSAIVQEGEKELHSITNAYTCVDHKLIRNLIVHLLLLSQIIRSCIGLLCISFEI